MSPEVPRNLPDGTYYFAEYFGHPSADARPMVMRAVVVDGRAHDESWHAGERAWVPTDTLMPYRYGRGENQLFAISQEQAADLVARRNAWWLEKKRADAVPFHFLKKSEQGGQATYACGANPQSLSETFTIDATAHRVSIRPGALAQVRRIADRVSRQFSATGSWPESGVEPERHEELSRPETGSGSSGPRATESTARADDAGL